MGPVERMLYVLHSLVGAKLSRTALALAAPLIWRRAVPERMQDGALDLIAARVDEAKWGGPAPALAAPLAWRMTVPEEM